MPFLKQTLKHFIRIRGIAIPPVNKCNERYRMPFFFQPPNFMDAIRKLIAVPHFTHVVKFDYRKYAPWDVRRLVIVVPIKIDELVGPRVSFECVSSVGHAPCRDRYGLRPIRREARAAKQGRKYKNNSKQSDASGCAPRHFRFWDKHGFLQRL